MTDKTDDTDVGTTFPSQTCALFIVLILSSQLNITDALRIGDMVLFKEAVRGLYLGVEGILLEDLVATDGFNLQDSLFCVHLQRQYSASRDLNAFLELYDMDIKSIEDEGAKKYLIALQVQWFALCLLTHFCLPFCLSCIVCSADWKMKRS